ncbi:hypothetical protein Gogos_021923 [Gossypium gossypioides]|uniref:Uncharacterized protein n=1 Tax=Gossypium gossypioides TaxID=34282 RepID=A0A7J9CYJ6_GOSGO|nr:hypothetical protein [Gossypium gossypioides]
MTPKEKYKRNCCFQGSRHN